jgi:putative glutamine amidotransferase
LIQPSSRPPPGSSPIIGITTYSRNELGNFYLPSAYLDAVRAAGGVPVLLTPGESDLPSLLGLLNGIVFSGGGDIEPEQYGGQHHHTVYAIDPERDEFDLALASLALQGSLPILGICRGMQVLNVAAGGNLVVHVGDRYGSQILHRTEQPRHPVEHVVQVEPASRLATILDQTEMPIVSWHHQAVDRLAAGWQVVASAADGVVEAMEHQHHPWAIALQWHPELSAEAPWHQRLFEALIDAAGQHRCAATSGAPISGKVNPV